MTEQPEPLDLAAIKARVANTLEGPWESRVIEGRRRVVVAATVQDDDGTEEDVWIGVADIPMDDVFLSEFIANSRQDVPRLVEEVERIDAAALRLARETRELLARVQQIVRLDHDAVVAQIVVVEDAIASRCVAKIDYTVPSPDDQARIWRVLADVAKIPLADETIAQLVVQIPQLTGRDIKMLLKLAQLISAANGTPVTLETIEFVRQFKPTKVVDNPG